MKKALARRLRASARRPRVAITTGLSSPLWFCLWHSHPLPASSADFLEENGFFGVTIARRSRMDGFLRLHDLQSRQGRDVLAAPFQKALARVSQDNYMYRRWSSRRSAMRT